MTTAPIYTVYQKTSHLVISSNSVKPQVIFEILSLLETVRNLPQSHVTSYSRSQSVKVFEPQCTYHIYL